MSERVWFITGSSTGFGRAIAEAALDLGDRVALTARSPERVRDLVERHPGRAVALKLDVTHPEEAKRAVAEAVSAFGRIDVLVNNAGFGLLGALEELSDDQIRRNLETNFIGPLNVIRAVTPTLKAQRSGHLVNISAVAAFCNEVGFSVYGGAKAALEAASDAVRSELAPFGVRVTVVEPGPFRTDFIGRSLEKAEIGPDYAATVGKFGELLGRVDGRQTGDPIRAAQAILRAVNDPNPPSRLVLGRYAVDKVRKKLDALRAELAAWEEVGLAADFPARSTP